jgi:hypothetical protein
LSPEGDELSPSGSWGICAPALPEVLTFYTYYYTVHYFFPNFLSIQLFIVKDEDEGDGDKKDDHGNSNEYREYVVF